jgi:hypothetical protein
MNKRQLFLVFSMIIAGNAVAAQDKTRTAAEQRKIEDAFITFFGYSAIHPFKSCERTISSDCDLITKHFIKATQHNQDRECIQALEDEMSRLSSDELLQRPVKRRLDEKKEKHPHGKKSYWTILPREPEQDALIDATANIAEKNNFTLSYSIKQLKETLDK